MKYLGILLTFLLFMWGCNQTIVKKSTIPEYKFPVTVTCIAARENVRLSPNGKIYGKIKKGDTLVVLNKVGNWAEINFKKTRAYVWSPSLGFAYINLYNPYTFIDSTRGEFLGLKKLNLKLGVKPVVVEKIGATIQYKYTNLGLGQRVEEVLYVAKLKTEIVEKTIQVLYDGSRNKITEVRMDLFKPIRGEKRALKKAGLATHLKPVEKTDSRVVYKLPTGGNPIYVTLKRKEWGSPVFIGYVVTSHL